MNKFRDPECEDYKNVIEVIKDFIGMIRQGTPLENADAWIRDKHYTKERLQIERLSGDPLQMDQCYINLTIVQKPSQNTGDRKEEHAVVSPFSIFTRQKVETPAQATQVELATIFNQRKGNDNSMIQPRRILIRGRAGVGKTTLCKRIVREFTQGSLSRWTELFDRILWVPLRNLKLDERRQEPNYDFSLYQTTDQILLENCPV
jgi:Cdc6-like AAA superfamily ATPase